MHHGGGLKIFLDVTETVANGLQTGIQRTVRQISQHIIPLAAQRGIDVGPVVAHQGRYYACTALHRLYQPQRQTGASTAPAAAFKAFIKNRLRRFPRLLAWAQGIYFYARRSRLDPGQHEAIRSEPGDRLLLLDSCWGGGGSDRAAQYMFEHGCAITLVVYDIIPLTHPQYYDATLVRNFRQTLEKLLNISSSVFAISQFVAESLRQWIHQVQAPQPEGVRLDYFHLGGDFDQHSTTPEAASTAWPAGLWQDGSRVFLMLGTIEPRKGHDFVLHEFERRWAEGSQDKLLWIGKVGWQVEALMQQVHASRHLHQQLWPMQGLSDAMVNDAIHRCTAIIFASQVEGFGLPLVEALQRGTPVLAHDIPVFREIAASVPVYFRSEEDGSLQRALQELAEHETEVRARTRAFQWLTWRDAAAVLLDKMLEQQPGQAPKRPTPTS